MSKVSKNFVLAFQNLLYEERTRQEISQLELAKYSGLTRQCLSLFESGRRCPTIESLFSLAEGLRLPPLKFLQMLLNKMDFYDRRCHLMAADSKNPKWRADRMAKKLKNT